MHYFDTFTGIGGFTLGIEQAYENNTRKSRQSKQVDDIPNLPNTSRIEQNEQHPLCIGYSEIDKYASSIYKYHYPNHTNYGDITRIDATTLPDFDLLVGGFPCQAFSIAGKRAGFEDTRGTLFFDLARILKAKQPRNFIFENVKGLLSHDNGNTFKTIISTLAELGYSAEWQVLNSKNYGVPQNRERIFIVGHLGAISGRQVFPLTGCNPKTLKQIIGGSQGERVCDTSGVSVTLASQAGRLGAKTGLYFIDLSTQEAKITDTARTIQARYFKGYSHRKAETSGVIVAQRGRYTEDGSTSQQIEPRKDNVTNTITSVQKDNLLLKQAKIRRLTPKECERLQAFPDNWTQYGLSEKGETIPISDSQRYKCCGNAVTVNVVQHIIEKLYIKE